MLDVSDVMDRFSGWFGQGNAASDLVGGNLADMVNNAGLDPSLLENLSLDHVGQWLADAGIDPASLSQGQIAEIVRQVGEGAAVDGLDVSTILNGGTGK